MPFGKYRGTPIGEVPTSYLSWLLRSIKLRDPQLEFEVQLEWLSRCAQHEHTYSEQTASRHVTGQRHDPHRSRHDHHPYLHDDQQAAAIDDIRERTGRQRRQYDR